MVKQVLIVGGGLAGPTLSLALAQYNIPSTIFELRPVKGDSGGSITLGTNALRTLDKGCKLSETILQSGFRHERIQMYDETGYRFGEFKSPSEYGGNVRILRSKIHEILLDECAKRQDLIKIHWGVKLTEVEESDTGVTVHFDTGLTATGDILIGADGIHSQVREYVLGDQAPKPVFGGSCTVNSSLPTHLITKPSPEATYPLALFTPNGIIMIIPNDSKGERAAWGVSVTTEEKSRKGFEEFEKSGEAARQVKVEHGSTTNSTIQSLLKNIDDTAVRLWSPYYIPDLPKWFKGRICLIGDAAHALPPAGQGSAMAFEDAVYLARLLGSSTSLNFNQIFTQFEKIRKSRIDYVKKLSKRSDQSKAKTGPLMWSIKKWMIWAYFAWNRFEIRDERITSYDVFNEPLE